MFCLLTNCGLLYLNFVTFYQNDYNRFCRKMHSTFCNNVLKDQIWQLRLQNNIYNSIFLTILKNKIEIN